MKKRIAQSPASTVKISAAGTLWSTKRARRRNARVAAEVVADTAAVVVVAVGTVAGVVVVAAVIVGIAAIVGIAGSALFFPFLTRFLCFGASALAPGAQVFLQKLPQGPGVPGCKFRVRKYLNFVFHSLSKIYWPSSRLACTIPPNRRNGALLQR